MNFQGTKVAVKRALPPQKKKKKSKKKITAQSVLSTSLKSAGITFDVPSEQFQDEDQRPGVGFVSTAKNFGSESKRSSWGTTSPYSGLSESAAIKKMRRDFIEEMRYLSTLTHPNIVTIMGALDE